MQRIRYTIGYNYDKSLLKNLKPFVSSLSGIFFPIPNSFMGSGRSSSQPDSYQKDIMDIIDFCKKNSISSEMLLNAACEGRNIGNQKHIQRVVSYLMKMQKAGLDKVIVTNPLYIPRIKKSTSLLVEVSVIADVQSLDRVSYFIGLGADSIALAPEKNWDIAFIRRVKERFPEAKIKLMLNDGCLLDCAFKHMHYNYISHHLDSEEPDELFCTGYLKEHPEGFFRIPIVRPEEVRDYLGLVDQFKLATRCRRTPSLLRVLKAYSDESYDGSITDLINVAALNSLGDIPNKSLDGLGYREKTATCGLDCSRCSYCRDLLNKVRSSAGIRRARIAFVHVSDTVTNLLPLGMIALANLARSSGFSVELIHLGLEKRLDPDFSLSDYLKEKAYTAACFSLHWFHQLGPVLKELRALKKEVKGMTTVLGGFTASYFASQLMYAEPGIDFIIRGDSEKPLVRLLKNLKQGSDQGSVPNLVYRDRGKIAMNPVSYVAESKDLDSLDFTGFSVIRNFREYLQRISLAGTIRYKNVFYFSLGRGCSVDCSYCSGSKSSQRVVNSRQSVVFMSADAVLSHLKKLDSYDIDRLYFAFDPLPRSSYYPELFKKIRKAGLDFSIDFECFGLPARSFIDEFEKTFRRGSNLIISPESGSEEIRKRNKGLFYSNSQLLKALSYMKKKDVAFILAFTAGLSYETRFDVLKTLAMINYIRRRFPDTGFAIEAIQMEPAAPRHLDSHKYEIDTDIGKFEDFSRIAKDGSLGYRTGSFSEDEIRSIVALYRAEASCIFKRSKFLSILQDSIFGLERFDINSLRDHCSGCTNYSICFRQHTNKNTTV
jgi:radical SAM superfamily enzyme YgiQ (UPF0313 family)/collagenase-like PrtC family protease